MVATSPSIQVIAAPKPVNKIGIVLLPSFNALATMALLDPLRAANYLHGSNLYTWELFSPGQAPIKASNGFVMGEVSSITTAPSDLDTIFVSSSWAPEQYKTKLLSKWLKARAADGTVLGGIDTGAVLLAHAGLLNGYAATVHYEHLAAFKELFREITVSEALFVMDRDRFTCCGGHAASDLSLELIRLQHGMDLANAAARYIFHDRLRTASEQQMPTRHEPIGYAIPRKLRQAIVVMERSIEDTAPMADICESAGLSQRQLARLFHTHTGVSPIRYYLDLRLDRARGLVTQTTMSVLEISVACGFSTPGYFTRAYKSRFGIPPLRDRVEGRIPFQFRSFPAHAFELNRGTRLSGRSADQRIR